MNNSLNNKYQIEIEIITPLHVGCGAENDWLKGIDFVYDKHKVYIISLEKLGKYLSVNELSKLMLDARENNIFNIIKQKKLTLNDISSQCFDLDTFPNREIKTQIRCGNSGKPILPGSSIKGALRSVLFKYLRNNQQKSDNEVFGKASDGTDFMRFIKIADAFFEETQLMQTKIFNLFNEHGDWYGGWKHGFHNTNEEFNDTDFVTTYETLLPLSKSSFSLSLATRQFQAMFPRDHGRKSQLMEGGIKNLFSIINKHNRSMLEHEKEFFEAYPVDQNENIIDFLDYLLGLQKRYPDACLLRLAAGSGFYSITGDWRFVDHLHTIEKPDIQNKYKRYKSRKFAFNYYDDEGLEFMPMGMIMLKEKA